MQAAQPPAPQALQSAPPSAAPPPAPQQQSQQQHHQHQQQQQQQQHHQQQHQNHQQQHQNHQQQHQNHQQQQHQNQQQQQHQNHHQQQPQQQHQQQQQQQQQQQHQHHQQQQNQPQQHQPQQHHQHQQMMPAPSPSPVLQHTQYSQPQYQQQPPQQQQQQQRHHQPPQHHPTHPQQQHHQQQPQQHHQQQQHQQHHQQNSHQQHQPQVTYQHHQQQAPPQPVPQHPQQAPAPPSQVQVQAQYNPHQGLNGGWQSDKDYQERRKMIAKIVHLLQQRKPNAPQEWLKKLPQMAKRLEESLYRAAKSFEEYNDASTLKQRLQQLAVNIGMKTKKMQQAQLAQQKLQQQQQIHAKQTQYRPAQAPPPMAPPQQQHVQAHAPVQPLQQPPPHQQQPMQQPPNVQQGGQRIVNVAEINPIMSGQPQQMLQPTPAPAPVQPAPAPQYQTQPQAPAPVAPPAPPQPTGQPPLNGARPAISRQVSDRQQVLRHQQQRLLLLRHAAKCQHEDNRCPITPHCAGMKRLWKHIAECKDQKCLVPHCVSSRYVLSHYHRCKDVRCPVCGPVREAIHRSHEKQKQMQALRQRHQQAVQQNHTQQAPAPSQPQAAPAGAPLPQPVQPLPVQPQPVHPQPVHPQPVPHAVPPIVAAPHPGIADPTISMEPPGKRQKTTPAGIPAPAPYMMPHQPQVPSPAQAGQPVQSQQVPPIPAAPHQPPSQPLPPGQPQPFQPSPSAGPTAISSQPPTIKAGYVYSGPAPAPPQTPGAPAAPGASAPGAPSVAPGQPGPGNQVATVPGIAFSNGQVIMPKHTGPKPQEDHTLINCFSIEQIELHIASLNKGLQLPPQKLKTKCLDVLRVLQDHQHGWVFNSPVDPVELGLPDYFEVIKRPMDLGTIRKKLENGCYHALKDFEGHVNLTFDNAMLYNPEGSVVFNMAKEMKEKFAQDYEVLIKQLNAEEDVKRRNGEACLLCGCEKLLFEPPVFYCNGFNCPSKRIRRNSYYYVGGNNQYHWCHQCYQELKDGKTIELADIKIRKDNLVKKKNDEVHEESWVQCDRCERWIHQICALFNTRQNKDQRSEYACPRCTIEERKKNNCTEATSTTPMAEDLQRTKLSEYLEGHVRRKVAEHLEKITNQSSNAEGANNDDLKKAAQLGGEITIRQVTSMDKKLEVRERMKKRYAFKNYPDEFNFRCKCIVVFQNLDGVDVILFGLYVYEHDEKNPSPNKRCVYISYLDSVHFMRPRQMRTFIYHEILISYLDYVRKRGFATAHIWACPPLKGDDYILYAKPEDQKTPKDDRLRQWYIDMLVESQKRGLVGKVTNMYDLYFSDEKNDATVVPYMDGDYFPAEVENIIKDIEEGKTGKKNSAGNQKKKKGGGNNKAKQKKKSGRGGTRSTGYDEDALKASGIIPPGKDQKSLEEGGRDWVMVKLGETIQPMKESFIVAFLAWSGAREEDMVVPKEIQEHREKHGVEVEWKPSKDTSSDKSSEEDKKSSEEQGDDATKKNGSTGENDDTKSADESKSNSSAPNSSTPASESNGSEAKPMDVDKPENGKTEEKKNEGDEKKDTESSSGGNAATTSESMGQNSSSSNAKTNGASGVGSSKEAEKGVASAITMAERKGKFAAMARKRGREEPKEEDKEKTTEPTTTTVKDSKGRMVKVIDDDAEEMDCEFLNNRQAFLNLCQGNHYQFDQLRRAKHSSMMVLWHLHNRDAPKFVQQCTTCSREILTGYRFHCPTCADFDQCQECVSNPKTPRHPHQLKPIPVASGQQSELTEAQRVERQRSIQLHMKLLLHAATCTSPKCPSANCTKMKGLLKHGAQCQVKATGGCNVCKRIWALLQIHARQCKASSCPVPNCMAIRERVRQLKKQQQAMDDRRRQEMNRAYRGTR